VRLKILFPFRQKCASKANAVILVSLLKKLRYIKIRHSMLVIEKTIENVLACCNVLSRDESGLVVNEPMFFHHPRKIFMAFQFFMFAKVTR